jgi:anti-sigma B factor antagonist
MSGETFPVDVTDGVAVVAAPQEIDVTNAEDLRSALLKAAANGNGTLVVDMSRTQFCDSSGLHTLIAAHKRAAAEGGEVRLVMTGAAVLRLFALTGMDRVIPNFPSLGEALTQTGASANGHDRQRDDADGPAAISQADAIPAVQLPGTLKRSSKEAQETFTRALIKATQVHGDGDQAVQAAYSEFKRAFEKRGDHWIPR